MFGQSVLDKIVKMSDLIGSPNHSFCLLAMHKIFYATIFALSLSSQAFAAAPPIEAGAYPVACSNIAQDFSKAPSDDARQPYWEGGVGTYISDLLSEPQSVLSFSLPVPNDIRLFPNLKQMQIPYAALVCYPTSADNPRPDYPFNVAGTRVVPKMQRGGEAPIWTDPKQRYPVILYSHGIAGSPLSGAYLDTMIKFASYGAIVVMPFHGDPRFASVHVNGLDDMVKLILRGGFANLVEMQAIRPRSLQALLNALLAHPDYAEHIDQARMVGFGISLGGQSMLLLCGGELTDRVTDGFFPSVKSVQVINDARLAAVFGYIPYFGQKFAPAFGDDQSGLAHVTKPVMAISGTADTTAPLQLTSQGFDHMSGSRYLVTFDGLKHELPEAAVPDVFTWAMAYYDSFFNGNKLTKLNFADMDQVSGGAADTVLVRYDAPGSAKATGTNPAKFTGKRANYTIAKIATGFTVTDNVGLEGVQVFTNIQRLNFSDVSVALDIDGTAGQVYRLYQAAFDRKPDLSGFAYQIAAVEVAGTGMTQLAQNFIDSPEFANRYGNLSDAQFITQLYVNVLHRMPDDGGLAFYLDGLATNAFSRARILLGFSASPENQNLVLGDIQTGMEYTTP